MNKAQFQKITKKNKKEVATWPKWKQKLVISAKNAESGNFYGEEEMTNEQILKKAIEKAEKNGFSYSNWAEDLRHVHFEHIDRFVGLVNTKVYHTLIFSHPFARAFWGEKDYWNETKCTCGGADFHLVSHDAHYINCAKSKAERGYKFHIQQMVVEEDRLKYIEKFLQ